jgi:GLPGLI family protein
LHINSEEKRKFFVAKILQEVYSNFYTQGEYSIIEKDLGGELFLIKKKINLDDWELINETQKIQNYTCYKAIRFFDFMHRGIKKTRKQIVWYSIDLPIYYGPKDFVGFPGLVLKVEDGNLIYEANKIILNPKEIVKIKEPSKKGKEISQKEYDKILEKSSITIRREINKRKKTEQ